MGAVRVRTWLSAFAAPGQIRAAVYEDPPLFSSELSPAVGPSIRQSAGPIFRLWHKWLGPQWSIGDLAGMRAAMASEIPSWMAPMLDATDADADGRPADLPQNLREYDPEWGDAFISGRVAQSCDHKNMLSRVAVPVLFTHHFHHDDPETGNLIGAISDQQVAYVRRLVEGAGNSFTYRAFPEMPHSMHGHDPAAYVSTVSAWLDGLGEQPEHTAG